MTSYRYDDWSRLAGAQVDVRVGNTLVCTGLVDSAMPDSSALWIAGEGPVERRLFLASDGYEIWIEPRPLRNAPSAESEKPRGRRA
jgi:hypothetical protein